MTPRPGHWPSPLGAEQVAAPGSRPSEVQVADGALYWSESRAGEGGRVAVVRWTEEHGHHDVVPADVDVRTRVNEYGGGAWRAGPGVLYASLRADGRIWAIPLGPDGVSGDRRPVTAESPAEATIRYADLQLTPDATTLICVRERPVPGAEALQELVAIRVSDGAINILAAGSSFVADPRISGDGSMLCWLAWSHPDMPWDAAALWVAELGTAANGLVDIADPRVVAGGRLAPEAGGVPVSVSDAAWGPDGSLWFASDGANGFWNAMVCAPGEAHPGGARPVDPGPWELSQPHWVFARTRLAPLPGGGALCARRIDGRDHLTVLGAPSVDPSGDRTDPQPGGAVRVELIGSTTAPEVMAAAPAGVATCGVDIEPQLAQVETFAVGDGPGGVRVVAAIVAGATMAPHVRWWTCEQLASLPTVDSEAAQADPPGDPIEGRVPTGPGAPDGSIDLAPRWVSSPQHLGFPIDASGERETPTRGGTPVSTTYALYYPPRNPEVGEPTEAPPLVVRIHGGPTSAAEWRYRADVQFWTTRGFAVADVNYRGSTGYGRPYRDALKGRWGEVDVIDCVTVAAGLAERGLADPDRLFIRGGSAGGFTALSAVAFHETFAAAASSYGVADLALLAAETHKFESRYLDGLVGPYPQEAELYRSRSPLFAVEGITVPVLVLQGQDDPVVPPSQADALVAALRRQGTRVEERRYEGEAHGWRRRDTIVDAMQAELEFFQSI
ncbi:MAG: prolyl oligopeptidase family serine peptidase [Microthrixaceae bacterium]